ncbi:MAG TPA: hypothetical protein VMG98_03695 [Verrucomicrobiae bacterium]|nr:hypothetical protein [Verrucomicrobiae bacterium]
MSEVIGDYRHFGDRVDFLAVDFLDTQAGLESVTNNFNVPFAVVRAMPQGTDDGQTASAGATTAPPSSAPLPIYIKGMTPEQFPRMVGFLAAAPMGSDAIKEINSYCSAHSAMECTQYAEAHGVVFGAAPSDTGAPALPHLFVIDADGIVRSDVGGFKVGRDDIPFELAKIGIR